MNLVARFGVVGLLLGSLMVFGCQPEPLGTPAGVVEQGEHEHEKHEYEKHETYAAAVTELDSLREAVKKAMADGNMEAADEAVHEVGHILNELPDLAAKDIDAADATVKPAIDDLTDCFDQIHEKVEGNPGKTYDELAERIEASMATLRDKVKGEVK